MSATESQYKKVRELKDLKFDVDQIGHCVLLMHVGPWDCQLAAVDSSNGRLVYLCDYTFHGDHSPAAQFSVLQKIVDTHSFAGAGFWKRAVIALKSQNFVQMPESVFMPSEARRYLSVVTQLDEDDQALSCKSAYGSSVVTIFSAQKALIQWAEERYVSSSISFLHQSASLIDAAFSISSQKAVPPICLYVDRFRLHITLVRDQSLLYYNCFPVSNFSDYVDRIMMVVQAMKMTPETAQVYLWGYLRKNSSQFLELSRYIRHVSLGERTKHLMFGHAFDEIDLHQFLDLYSLYRLVPIV